MAGYTPNAWAARLLEATSGRTPITATTTYLGLATSVPEDPLTATLANITEVTTAGYARIAVPTWSAASAVAPVRQTTPTAFSFAAFTADQAVEANYAFLCDVLNGTAGILRYLFILETPVLGKAGEPLNVPASTLIIE